MIHPLPAAATLSLSLVLLAGCGGSPAASTSNSPAGQADSTMSPVSTKPAATPAATQTAPTPPTPAAPPLAAWLAADPFAGLAPGDGKVIRVGGDMTAQVERKGDAYAFGTALIDTPLPVGYPAPTPPGAIELKRYPVVRRAQVSGTVSPDMASNLAFFPLFNHIKRRDIAMTSPVEMDYSNLRTRIDQEERPIGPSAWNMAFLYRTTDQGPTGEDERNSNVVVLDAEPITVLSMGMQGGYALARTTDAVLQLEQWLAANPQWEAVNEDARAFFYNGPDRRNKDKWAEAQLAVRFVGDRKK
jgi:hypothetical protein